MMYAQAPFGLTATALDFRPARKVVRTVSLATSIAVDVHERKLVTYAVRPSGVMATRFGLRPTVMVLRTWSVARSSTETSPASGANELVTKAVVPSGVMAMALGPRPTGITASTVPLATPIAATLSAPRWVT